MFRFAQRGTRAVISTIANRTPSTQIPKSTYSMSFNQKKAFGTGAFVSTTTMAAAGVVQTDNKPAVCPVNHFKYDVKTDKKYVDEVTKLSPKIKKAIEDIMEDDSDVPNPHDGYGHYGPIFVRLAWHASGTYDQTQKNGGSSGGCMRFEPEAGHGANAGLATARQRLEQIKKLFPQISYADLYTYAGKVAADYMLGEDSPTVPFRFGRSDYQDGSHFKVDRIRLPDGALGTVHIRDVFTKQMGFNDREIVALLGGHAVGKLHGKNSGFCSSLDAKRDMPWTYAPTTLGNHYYTTLLEEKWIPVENPHNNMTVQYENEKRDLLMLHFEVLMLSDPKLRPIVEEYAKDEKVWKEDFTKAFGKLLELGVEFPQ